MEECCDLQRAHSPGVAELTVSQSPYDLPLGIEDRHRRDASPNVEIELGHQLLAAVALADVERHQSKGRLHDRPHQSMLQGTIEGLGIGAPIGSEDHRHVFFFGRRPASCGEYPFSSFSGSVV